MSISLEEPFWIGDRCFTPDDIKTIQEIAYRTRRFSRSEIIATVCENLDWKAPNGNLKRAAGRQLLEEMESLGLVTLPPKRGAGKPYTSHETDAEAVPALSLHAALSAIQPVTLDDVQDSERRQWNATVAAYHPLGYTRPIGAHQRYWIRVQQGSERQIIGAMLFGAAAKAVACRDEWIGWSADERRRFRWRIVNNNRFLIIPGVKIPHLASHVLSIASHQLRRDWPKRYGYQPVLLETFIEPPWTGTSYQAANWEYVGETAGRGRQDRYSQYAVSVKSMWVHPLTRHWRQQLCAPAPQFMEDED